MTPKPLPMTVKLIGFISICTTTVFLALPCLAQTIVDATVVSPTVISPVSSLSTDNFNSQVPTSQSSNLCHQVDENSKIYTRYQSGGNRYYVENSPSSYNQVMTTYPRCN
jgi:hypothetical protein